jgi:hypothetical protein
MAARPAFLPVAGLGLRPGLLRRALVRFAEEMAAAKRRAAMDPLERETARRVAKWFVFQGQVMARVLGKALGDRMDRDAELARLTREQAAGDGRLTEALSWSDWEYLINQVLFGDHPGGVGALRDIIADGRTTAYAVGAEGLLAELGLAQLGLRIGVGSAEAVAHARQVAARQVTRINDTTRAELRTLITQAVEHGWSWNRTAEAISERYKEFAGRPLFPSKTYKSRAEMVAAYEIGDAYEAGGAAQAQRAAEEGVSLQKAWLNAGDARVRHAHRDNAAAGWLPLDAVFPEGVQRPPTDPGCRCALMYRVAPAYWGETGDEP